MHCLAVLCRRSSIHSLAALAQHVRVDALPYMLEGALPSDVCDSCMRRGRRHSGETPAGARLAGELILHFSPFILFPRSFTHSQRRAVIGTNAAGHITAHSGDSHAVYAPGTSPWRWLWHRACVGGAGLAQVACASRQRAPVPRLQRRRRNLGPPEWHLRAGHWLTPCRLVGLPVGCCGACVICTGE